MLVLYPSLYVRTRPGTIIKEANRGNSKMLKKVTTDVKAAVVLIVTENLTALRMFVKNATNSVVRFVSKHQQSDVTGQKKP